MLKRHSNLSIIAHTLCALLFGVGVAYLSWGGISTVLYKGTNATSSLVKNITTSVISQVASLGVVTYENKTTEASTISNSVLETKPPVYIKDDKIEIPTEGKFLTADLSAMVITLYENGRQIASLPISTIGRGGSAWETPRGRYQIETKERTHFSSIGKVYMPFSMQFNGNYFIHGWTYYPDGTPVSAEFSGGCIKLKTADAEKIYNFVSIGTPVYVFNSLKNNETDSARYLPKTAIRLPDVSAKSFLIADVDSGEILAEKNREAVLPARQVSQLLSSLVTLDAIHFFNETRVKPGQITEFGSATLLLPGEKIVVKDLLYPMLFGDNGVAATSLATVMGNNTFVTKMNKRAESIGLTQSVFTDPAGLDLGNLSSATDLFKLTRHIYIFKNYLWGITRELEKTSGRHVWHNQNGLSNLPGFLGGFRGQTVSGEAAAVGLFSVPIDSKSSRVVAVTLLDSADAIGDLARLSEYARSGFVFTEIAKAKTKDSVIPPIPTTVSASTTLTTLVFVGDIMLDRGVKKSIISSGGNFSYPFANLDKVKNSDILFGNLEGPVSDKGRNVGSIYSFRMDPKVVSVLQDQGFDVLSVANNHIGDWTRLAFTDTLANFSDTKVMITGGGLTKSLATEPKIIEKNGVKFGYLGFSDVGPKGLEAGTTTPGILLAGDPTAPEVIKAAADQCDVLIVAYHFGNEYEKKSNWRQRELAHMAIDNGARVVVGTHPHVAQETENYRGGVIMYSLGNFIFDQYFSADTMSGLAVKITFDGKNISKIEEFKTSLDKNYRVSVE